MVERRSKPPSSPEPSGKRATMATVGRLAGVTQATVSRALNDPSKVSPATLEKVQEAIAVTGFVPNALAGALASRKSKLISALVPSITNIVYSTMIKTFSDAMRTRGYQILLSETGFLNENEESVIATHLSRRPDAILLTGIHHSQQARMTLLGAGIPVVEVWDLTDSPIDICVGFSHADAGRQVADFTIQAGYETAGTISAGDERAIRRKDAFVRQYCATVKKPVIEANFDGPATLGLGRTGLAQMIDQHGFSGGVIFCSSDLLAHGAIIEAHSRGLRVPEDIAVIGFGDQDFAADIVPGITTVKVDRAALGQAAATAILNRLQDNSESGEKVLDLGFQILRRGSA